MKSLVHLSDAMHGTSWVECMSKCEEAGAHALFHTGPPDSSQ